MTNAMDDLFGRSYEDFAVEFENACSKDLSEEDTNKIFQDFPHLTMPGAILASLESGPPNKRLANFPLKRLKSNKTYQKTIKSFLESENPNKRLFGYVSITSAGDDSFNRLMHQRLKTEKAEQLKLWAALALLFLQDNHTSDLFDFLIEVGGENSHLAALYLRLDKRAIRQTAYQKIRSENPRVKILALQSLSCTGLNRKTEQIVKEAVRSWDPSIKRHVIEALIDLRIPRVKELLLPVLEDKILSQFALEALARSPSPHDRKHFLSLVAGVSDISATMLDACLQSDEIPALKEWFKLVRGPIPDDYHFFAFQHPLLSSDELLEDVRDTIRNTANINILQQLPRALEGRNDPESVAVLIELLSHKDDTVRYWAARILDGNTSAKLVAMLPSLLRNPKTRTSALTDLVIQNGIDGLQEVFEKMLEPTGMVAVEWQRAAARYLSSFPRPQDRDLLRAILQRDEDISVKRDAALGLGKLKDRASDELIIAAMKEINADENVIPYVMALYNIRSERGKSAVSSLKESNSRPLRKLVTDLLMSW